MAKILKNDTVSGIFLADVGQTIAASSSFTIDPSDYDKYAQSTDVITFINNEDIIVNDGINDLPITDGINFLKYPDSAFNIRFLAEPERNNGFVSKTVQEGIEEAKAAIEGKVSVLPTFFNNGLTKNKWLALDGSMNSSDVLPAITSFDSRLAAITFINGNNNADTDVEIYSDGLLVFTWYVRNKRYAYKTNNLSGIMFFKGDRISCFCRQVMDHSSQGGNGTGVDPSSVIVFINVQTTNSVNGEGGSSTL